MRVLVAPDKFRGTLSAKDAADAIATGWRRADRGAEIETVPMADGGEGTLDAMVAALGGDVFTETVTGPLGDPTSAQYAVVRGADGPLAVVEMARASGLPLVAPSRRDPMRTTTRGTGELILAACRRGVRRVLVCIGGSATNDGGAGMAQAVGIRLLDANGREVRPGGAALRDLLRIDMSGLDPAVAAADVVVASDVDNPLVGPRGASAVYGPQKGASAADVDALDAALRHFAAVIHRDLGVDVREMPGAGAAGGLGAGLIAFLGARLRRGIDVVMEAVRLAERMQGRDVVVTGEGSFDEQSLRGKVPAGVLSLAEAHRVPALVVCGVASVAPPGVRVWSLVERFGEERALADARPALTDLAEDVAATFVRETAERETAEREAEERARSFGG
jgi:glycerate 2-kinase